MPLLGDHRHAELVQHWKTLASTLPAKPEAILVVSGHWEVRLPNATEILPALRYTLVSDAGCLTAEPQPILQEKTPTVNIGAHPGMLYDYHNFPKEVESR